MIKYLLWVAVFAGLLACSGPQPQAIYGETMGTTYSVKIADANEMNETQLKDAIDSVLQEVNRQMSTYIPQSEISRFNRFPADEPFVISPGFAEVLQVSRQVYLESEGAFDVTVGPLVNLWGFGTSGRRVEAPPADSINAVMQFVGMNKMQLKNGTIFKTNPLLQLDLSSVAKGYGVDVVAELLRLRGNKNFMVEIGGEMVLSGTRFGEPWRVGIDRPAISDERELQHIIEVSNKALATSGDYRNYFIAGDSLYAHTINPVTGRPVRNGVASATVIADNCTQADAMATALMVLGEERGLTWVESKPEVEALIILRENGAFREVPTSGFMEYLVQE